jgi:tetratricopeptide (TPR) repeat protein
VTTEDEVIASIFKEFKSGVAKTLAKDDYETRFDLGIAYRGMELYDDAMGEFQICLDSASHKLESLHMMGLCAIDLERFSDASNHLEQALSSEELPTQKEAGLRFDLARSFEAQEDFARAKDAFEAAKAADDTLPGIDDCIARVDERLVSDEAPIELEPSADANEGFENFDDLVAEVEAEDAAAASEETFESFDDAIVEAEAEGVFANDDAASNEPEAVEEQPSDEPEPEPTKKKRRKKRISFV